MSSRSKKWLKVILVGIVIGIAISYFLFDAYLKTPTGAQKAQNFCYTFYENGPACKSIPFCEYHPRPSCGSGELCTMTWSSCNYSPK